MLTRVITAASCVWMLLLPLAISAEETWPQFRGAQGAAISRSADALPDAIGPSTNVIWKLPLPPGHSSPVLDTRSIYLTGVEDGRLFTTAIERADGTRRWTAIAPHEQLEQIHTIGSHAQANCVTDGERVYSFFGSCGLFCYDVDDGSQVWHRPLGPFNNDFGAATSPILAGSLLILCQDHDTGSFLTAIDKETGETIWRTDRSEFPRNYCTPVVVDSDGVAQIVVAATLRVVGYDLKTGREAWTVRGIARAACSSPAIDEAGTVYIASYAGGGDPGSRISVPPFHEELEKRDANGNGTLEVEELEAGGAIHQRYSQVDRDKSGQLTREEYEYFRGLFDKSRNVVLALRPGGQGDVTHSNVLWESQRHVPFIASPVCANGHLFMIKDGGILSSLDAATGDTVKVGRLDAGGNYYSSPVVGDGKLYLISERGQLTVVTATGQWDVRATADFAEDAYATPAIADGRIYLRTSRHVYCFGNP